MLWNKVVSNAFVNYTGVLVHICHMDPHGICLKSAEMQGGILPSPYISIYMTIYIYTHVDALFICSQR